MIFTLWIGRDDDSSPDVDVLTLMPGEDIPRFPDGSPQHDHLELLYTIEAETWEAACAEHYRRQGWGEYRPMTDWRT
jgi:hypothetical protein